MEMRAIVVDDQQAAVIRNAGDTVEILDKQGRRLGYVAADFTDEDIAAARRRVASDEPRYTTAEVLEHLASLETQ